MSAAYDPLSPEAIEAQRAFTAARKAREEEIGKRLLAEWLPKLTAGTVGVIRRDRKRRALQFIRQPYRLEFLYPGMASANGQAIVAFAELNLDRVLRKFGRTPGEISDARALLLFARFNRLRERKVNRLWDAA